MGVYKIGLLCSFQPRGITRFEGSTQATQVSGTCIKAVRKFFGTQTPNLKP